MARTPNRAFPRRFGIWKVAAPQVVPTEIPKHHKATRSLPRGKPPHAVFKGIMHEAFGFTTKDENESVTLRATNPGNRSSDVRKRRTIGICYPL